MKDNRSKRASIAQETLAILESKVYEVDGSVVSIENELAECLDKTKLYTPDSFDDIGLPNQEFDTQFEITNETTLSAARRLYTVDNRAVAALNFASAKNPGGGFLGGSQAQEESLARSSGLYSSLLTKFKYYEINRECKTTFYTEHMIYSPETPVFRDDNNHLLSEVYTVNFITSPAVNRGALLQHNSDCLDEVDSIMRNRIANVLKAALENGNTKIILGAWGCGVFKNSPANIAALFKDAFETEFNGLFEHVIFAVLDNSKTLESFNAFDSLFGN